VIGHGRPVAITGKLCIVGETSRFHALTTRDCKRGENLSARREFVTKTRLFWVGSLVLTSKISLPRCLRAVDASDDDDSGFYVVPKVEYEGLEVLAIPTNKASQQGQWHKRYASKNS
jgi:hypothetical protein